MENKETMKEVSMDLDEEYLDVEDIEDEDDDLLSPEEEDIQSRIETKEDLFRYIDSKLTEEERTKIMNQDSFALHFGFGTWLRNLVIYPDIIDVGALLDGDSGTIEIDGERLPLIKFGHPDMDSTELIEAYLDYLMQRI